MQQLNIPSSDRPVEDWDVEGTGFVQLTEDQFKEKLPQQVSPLREREKERERENEEPGSAIS